MMAKTLLGVSEIDHVHLLGQAGRAPACTARQDCKAFQQGMDWVRIVNRRQDTFPLRHRTCRERHRHTSLGEKKVMHCLYLSNNDDPFVQKIHRSTSRSFVFILHKIKTFIPIAVLSCPEYANSLVHFSLKV